MLAKPTNGVVVGSGASGSWAVKELTAGDLKVVLFEADRNVDIAHDFLTDT
jgi:choline dehydrogenase-like flavoprotein